MGGIDPDTVYTGFKNLERRGIISKPKPALRNYKFTKKGRIWLKASSARHFKLNYGVWDKKWRVIVFDIPQSMHKERNYLRRKLQHLGCYMLQKSIFVFPYSCSEELGYLCSNIGIGDYVDVLIADSIGSNEREIKKYFNL
jgi:phenylacetic acid degradation operon negative regulatory protein